MTSEIAVMNQRAVALAADSAVTLIDGGTVVVRNEQRKLFNLHDGRPVAIMFFGVADLLGHPWDVVIEHFQARAKAPLHSRLGDYAEQFVNALDGEGDFLPRDRQKEDYRRLLASVFRYIFRYAQFLRDGGDPALAQASDVQILELAIERLWQEYQQREDGSARPDLPCFPAGFARTVEREHSGLISELVEYGFGGFSLSKTAILRLKDIAVFCVTKDLFVEDVTGLVVSGYGKEDRYPVTVTYYVSAVVSGIAKRARMSVDEIGTENRSRIRVFADSEVTHAFIRGIDFNLERRLYAGFWSLLHGVVDELISGMPGASDAAREELRRRYHNEMLPQYFNALRNMIGAYQQQVFVNPVLRVLEIAARKELAETARDLVELNVFKKRIMAKQETVGGTIDVAVISREGGFQWWSKPQGA